MEELEEMIGFLTGPRVAVTFVKKLLEVSAEFREDHKRYVEALAKLRSEHGTFVDEVYLAMMRQCASDLAYAGMLGLKMNLDHFLNPMLPDCTWPQIDYSDYLREDVAHSLPAYKNAEAVLEVFYQKLSNDQKPLYDAIAEYQSHLVTVGPKLAHYYGYILGNELLPHFVPGYRSDPLLSLKYTEMLSNYFKGTLSEATGLNLPASIRISTTSSDTNI